MTGLEKIIDQILADAKTKADEIAAAAQLEADQILADAKLQADKITADIQKKSELDVANYKKSVASANDLYRRTEVLKAKQEVISHMIQAAYEEVCAMEPAEYFALLEKMLAKNVVAQEGILCLSEKDLNRMPEDFADRVAKVAKATGGTLEIFQNGKNIENGFVLVYGDIEDNCSIKAMFDAKRDQMQDTVNALLYRKEV